MLRNIQSYFPYVTDSLDRRDKMKPSVMITSPGSPDINTIYRSRNSRFMQGANSSIGGRIQVNVIPCVDELEYSLIDFCDSFGRFLTDEGMNFVL